MRGYGFYDPRWSFSASSVIAHGLFGFLRKSGR